MVLHFSYYFLYSSVRDCFFFSCRCKLQCTLFGRYVDDLNNFMGAVDMSNVVVIIQFAKVETLEGIFVVITIKIQPIYVKFVSK